MTYTRVDNCMKLHASSALIKLSNLPIKVHITVLTPDKTSSLLYVTLSHVVGMRGQKGKHTIHFHHAALVTWTPCLLNLEMNTAVSIACAPNRK